MNTYVNNETGREQKFSDVAFKNMSKEQQGKWTVKQELKESNLGGERIPLGAINGEHAVINNATPEQREIQKATATLEEAFEETSIEHSGEKSIEDYAITAAAALRRLARGLVFVEDDKKAKEEQLAASEKKYDDLLADFQKLEEDKKALEKQLETANKPAEKKAGKKEAPAEDKTPEDKKGEE